MTRTFGIALVVVLLAGTPGRAQLMTNPVQDYINKTQLLNAILSNRRATDMSQRRQQTRGKTSARGRTKTAPPAAPAPAPEPTAFAPASTTVLPDMLANAVNGDAAHKAEAKQAFETLISLYRQTAQKDGFPANDLAYAFEYYVVNSYLTYHDLHDVDYDHDPRVRRGTDPLDRLRILNEKKAMQVSISQERAVYQQFKTLLGGNDAVRALTDRQKQEVTELLAIMLGMNIAAYMQGVNAGDDAAIARAHDAARAGLERLTGAPIDRIKIGNNGLEQ